MSGPGNGGPDWVNEPGDDCASEFEISCAEYGL